VHAQPLATVTAVCCFVTRRQHLDGSSAISSGNLKNRLLALCCCCQVWDSAIVAAKYVEKWPQLFAGKRCCDLSAGCGLVGKQHKDLAGRGRKVVALPAHSGFTCRHVYIAIGVIPAAHVHMVCSHSSPACACRNSVCWLAAHDFIGACTSFYMCCMCAQSDLVKTVMMPCALFALQLLLWPSLEQRQLQQTWPRICPC
jgi:hypothetical protein